MFSSPFLHENGNKRKLCESGTVICEGAPSRKQSNQHSNKMAATTGPGTLLLRRPLPPLQRKDDRIVTRGKKSKGDSLQDELKKKPVFNAPECQTGRQRTVIDKKPPETDKEREYQRRLELLFLHQKPKGWNHFPFRSPRKPLQVDFNAFIDDSYEPPPPAFELNSFLLKSEGRRITEGDEKIQMHLVEKPLNQWHVYEKKDYHVEKQPSLTFQRISMDDNVTLPDVQTRIPYHQKLIEEKAYSLDMYDKGYQTKFSRTFGPRSQCHWATARPTFLAQDKKFFIGEDDVVYESTIDNESYLNEETSFMQEENREGFADQITDSLDHAHTTKNSMDRDLFLVNSPPLFFQGELSARSPSPFDSAGQGVSSAELAVLESIAHGGIKLNLKAHFIDHLPDIIQLSATLVQINLSFNDFMEIPQEIFHISQLEVLKLRNNPVIEIHEDIKRLTKLRTLVLSFCCISSIPHSVFQLKSLEKLDLSYNHIAFISDELKYLRSLKVLNLEGNQLTSFPRGIILLNLHILKVANNFIHPMLWKLAAPPQPQQLLENSATVLAQTHQHLDVITDDLKLKSFLKSISSCDFCGGPKFGQGIRVIKPAAEIFGVKNLPILFFVCSQNCRNILRQSTELSLFPET